MTRLTDHLLIAPDKANHFVWGAIIAKGASLIARIFGANDQVRFITGMGTALFAALLKELLDKKFKIGKVDRFDVFWTVLGATTAMVDSHD